MIDNPPENRWNTERGLRELLLLGMCVVESQRLEFSLRALGSQMIYRQNLPKSVRKTLEGCEPHIFPNDLFSNRATMGQLINAIGDIAGIKTDGLVNLLERRNKIMHSFIHHSHVEPEVYHKNFLGDYLSDCGKWTRVVLGCMTNMLSDKTGISDEDLALIDDFQATAQEYKNSTAGISLP